MKGTEPHRGGASSRVATPGSAKLFSAPAIRHVDGMTWIYAADNVGTAAWTLHGDKLHPEWHNDHGGTSPVVADGLVYVYDPEGGLRVYEAGSGRQVGHLDCGSGHWNSPIVADGRIVLPVGNANAHRTSGVIDIWRVKKQH